MQKVIAVAVVLAAVLWPGAGRSHDVRGLGNPSEQFADDLNVHSLLLLSDQQPDPDARYVYSRLLLWNPGQMVLGCFRNGTAEERGVVVQTAKELLDGKGVNLMIDFGVAPQFRGCSESGRRGDVRVSFLNTCCAAYIGRTAYHPDVKDGPSVFLQGILAFNSNKRRQIVMHELLHSIGLNHEHQNPGINCADEFDKAAILTAYGWTEQEFRTNMQHLQQDAHSYKWSSYDADSIMKYYFDPSLLKNGEHSRCYTQENYLPSEQDYEGLRDAYPVNVAVTGERRRAALGAIEAFATNPKAVRDLARELRALGE